jgi:hypothetical protein
LFVTTDPADFDDLSVLARFAQLAMARAEAASARAEAVEAEGGDPTPHLIAFDRMGRALRLALSLRRRFAGEAQAFAAQRVRTRKEQLKAALSPAICVHADVNERRQLQWELDQRLETEADIFAELPLETGLDRLRQILGLPAFVHTDMGDAGGCNPLSRHAPAAPPQGEQPSTPVPPPARSAIRGRWREAPEGVEVHGAQRESPAEAPGLSATGPP